MDTKEHYDVNLIKDCPPSEPSKVTAQETPGDYHKKIRGDGGKTLPAEYFDTKFGRA